MFDPLAWDELWIPEEPEEDEDDKVHQNCSLKFHLKGTVPGHFSKCFFHSGASQPLFSIERKGVCGLRTNRFFW